MINSKSKHLKLPSDDKIVEILAPVSEEEEEKRKAKVQSRFWQTAKKAARQVPFMEDLVAAYYCALDPQTPSRTRGILLASLAYFILPTDLIPDFLAGFGFSDDIAVITAALSAIKSELKERHFIAARKALAEEAMDEAEPDSTD